MMREGLTAVALAAFIGLCATASNSAAQTPGVTGATTTATPATVSPVPSLPVDVNDYYQLRIVPEFVRPNGQQIDCRRRDPAASNNVPRWLRDYWINMADRSLRTGVSVAYAGASGPITHTFPVFEMASSNGGRHCVVKANRATYLTPLLQTFGNAGTIFSITTAHAVEEELDDTALSGFESVVTALGVVAGAPEPVANAIGGFARNQLQDHTHLQPSSTDMFQLSWQQGYSQDERVPLVNLNTKGGPVTVTERAHFQSIASAIVPMTGRVPDLRGNPRAFLQLRMGQVLLPAAVDQVTERGWTRYNAATAASELSNICQDVHNRLTENGYSFADAAALTWLMTRTHRNEAAVRAMQRPACITQPGQDVLLLRYGVTLPNPVPPQVSRVGAVLTANDAFRRFFMPPSEADLREVATSLFVYDDTQPTTVDRNAAIFVRGENYVPGANTWNAYLPGRPARIQCLTVVDNAALGGVSAIALATNTAGAEVAIVANFANALPNEPPRITRVTVAEGALREAAYGAIRTQWVSAGQCEDRDAKPVSVFGEPTPQPAPAVTSPQ